MSDAVQTRATAESPSPAPGAAEANEDAAAPSEPAEDPILTAIRRFRRNYKLTENDLRRAQARRDARKATRE